ncbi:hypothetical protein IT570_09200 [Candidatus Sumerlaeota bacterium]|nr:hypothetical protein [Candidatus Sumerlaeota bacterium]
MKRSLRAYFCTTTLALLAFSANPSPAPCQANNRPKLSWHWHMHQPIYWNDRLRTGAVDRYEYAWESIQQKNGGAFNPENNLSSGEDGVFSKSDRVAAYQYRMRDAIDSIRGSNPYAGAAVSYSGALIENVKSLGNANQLGYTPGWKNSLNEANNWTTSDGEKRLEFTNFSHHHALLALLPPETVYMELRLNQEILKREFGQDAVSKGFFPTEMCFSERLIPVLKQLGIEWSIVSGEKIARAMPDFPLVIGSGGVNCDLPNRADKINPNGVDFIRTTISRGCSPVNANPMSYQPAYAKWVNPDTGVEESIVVVPADQGFGWNDGYGCINADFFTALESKNNTSLPSLVLLSHDGDNAFGGGFSYYNECVPNLASDARGRGNEVTSIQSYLNAYGANITNTIHVEDGGWVNADGDFGSPTFINWNYPLLNASGQHDPVNGWHEKAREMAIFVATENLVRTAQQMSNKTPDFAQILDPGAGTDPVDRAWHYYLGSLDSGNVYYGDPLDLEIKGTIGCNEAARLADPIVTANADNDLTPPTIWLPQRHPYNPGSANYGVQYQYRQVVDDGDFHIWTFIADTTGPVTATLKYRVDADGANPLSSNQNETYAGGGEVGAWQDLAMSGHAYSKGVPAGYNKPGLNYWELPVHIADHYSVEVTGLRDKLIDYYIEAVDGKGNVSRSPIQHVYIGTGEGSGGGGGGTRVTINPSPAVRGEEATITYKPAGGPLASAPSIYIHRGKNGWQSILSPRPALTDQGNGEWTHTFTVDADATAIDCVFTTTSTGGAGTWDNNGGADWHFSTVASDATATPSPSPSPTGAGSPTPSPTAGGTPSVSPTASPTPGQNPFVMDGVLDSGTCAIEGGLNVKEQDGWLYIAASTSVPSDLFIYVTDDPTTSVAANWAKGGQVSRWQYFLAVEGNNSYSSWFDIAGASIADDSASYVKSRNGAFIEGAIRKNLVGGANAYVSLGIFGTNDGGTLTAQSPPSEDSNANINANETFLITTGTDPCGATPTATPTMSPSPSASPVSTASPSVSPTILPTASATASPTTAPSASPSPTDSPTPTVSLTPSATTSPTSTQTSSPTATVSPTATPTVSPSTSATATPAIDYDLIRRVLLGITANPGGLDVNTDDILDSADIVQ